MHPMLNIAIRAARAAGNIIANGFDNQTEDTTIDMDINDKLDGTRGT